MLKLRWHSMAHYFWSEIVKEVSFHLSKAGQLVLRYKKRKEGKLSCNKCDFVMHKSKELETHTEKVHKESNILNEAQTVIELIKRDMQKPKKDENIELEYIGLKRSNITSPKGPKGKTQKKSVTIKRNVTHNQNKEHAELSEVKEDLMIIKQERDELKSENENLRNKLKHEHDELLSEKEKVMSKLKKHEEDAVKAMRVIAKEVKEETSKLNQKHKVDLNENMTKFEKKLQN